jgi:hypothetical protein
MLPRARIMLAATLVTAILVTLAGTMIVPVPADSYVSAAALPRVEQPAEHARMLSPKEQSRMPAYRRLDDRPNQTRPVESSSNGLKTMDSGTSTFAKTQTRLSEDQAERAARSSSPAPDPEQPGSNSTTKSVDVVATGNVNGASMATGEPRVPHSDVTASFTAGTRNDCEQRKGRTGFHLFRPAQFRLHAHHRRPRHRTWASRGVIGRSDAHQEISTYSTF